MIGVDGGIGLEDVFEDRCVVPMNQVREIRTGVPPFALHAMAFVTGNSLAEEESLSLQPTASRQFGNVAVKNGRRRLDFRAGPGQKEAAQRKGPGGVPVDRGGPIELERRRSEERRVGKEC